MRKKPLRLLQVLLAASLSTLIYSTAAQEPSTSFEQALKETGWSVQRETDGTLRLQPPGTGTSVTQKAIDHENKSRGAGLSQAMQQQLRDAGWRITDTSDGSILLFPPRNSVAEKPRPCPGSPLKIDITLPVDNWHEAYRIARSWLKDQTTQPPFHAVVGKIRKILDVHVVSIVSDQAPYPLIQQIAIRKSDGAVIVLN